MLDLDRYYTPRELAEELLSDCKPLEPSICVDSTCGEGNLLEAANTVFGSIQCIGIDKDKKAINALRRRKPQWTLSVADLLNPNSVKKTSVATKYLNSDLLILNPPFSIGRKKSHSVEFKGKEIKSSIAMAHVLTSLELFKPKQGAFLIVPESLLYSETDGLARELLFSDYSCTEKGELHCSTFSGARVRSVAIKLTPGVSCRSKVISNLCNEKILKAKVIRGGLPVHEKFYDCNGMPYVHTTDLSVLYKESDITSLSKVSKCTRGHVDGWVILIPRVGIPHLNMLKPVFLECTVQLSDCVIALSCKSKTSANNLVKRINSNGELFENHYKGTGARYTTISRLKDCLGNMCISTSD